MTASQEDGVESALRGDYRTSDRIAVAELEQEGETEVLSRGTTLAAIPHIEHRIRVVRDGDCLFRLLLDRTGELARPGGRRQDGRGQAC